MKKIKNKLVKLIRIFFLVTTIFLFITKQGFSNDSLNWSDANVYKPKPVLFLHGFAKGNPDDWLIVKSSLGSFFSKYSNAYNYLESIDFIDPNGSIDRYFSGKFNPQGNSAGWADKLKAEVDILLGNDKYGSYTSKINLVCHSMSGLAARWYLANYSNDFVDKLILIGVPNLGTRWAELANAASKIPKVGWMQILSTNGISSKSRDTLSFVISNLEDIDIFGEAVKDMDATSNGSGFINNLNSISQTDKVSYYGVIGIISSLMNRVVANGDYYGGDGIVSKNSQLGLGEITYKEWVQVDAIHWKEIEKSGSGSFSPILYFLDSTPPEVIITSPDPNIIQEFSSTSVDLVGYIFKEYLPADTKLHIKVIRDSDGTILLDEDRTDAVKPSSFWFPNIPESPVAEFSETIGFLETGTFRIIVTAVNPAGIPSTPKETKVRIVSSGPLIQPLRIDGTVFLDNKTIHRRSLIEAFITSYPANIDWSSVVLTLDGVTVIPQIDLSKTYPVFYTPVTDLALGKHTATIKIKDVLGVWSETKIGRFEVVKWQESWEQAPLGNIIYSITSEGGEYLRSETSAGYGSNYHPNSRIEILPERSLRIAHPQEYDLDTIAYNELEVRSKGVLENWLEPNTYISFNVGGFVGSRGDRAGIYLIVYGRANDNAVAIVYVAEKIGDFHPRWRDAVKQYKLINLGYGSHTRNLYNDFLDAFGAINASTFSQGQISFYVYTEKYNIDSVWDNITLYQDN